MRRKLNFLASIEQIDSKKRTILIFSIFFATFVTVLFMPFIVTGKTFVSYDGIRQHLVAYIYYGRFVREILYNIFINHEFLIPQFDMNIGYGSDIFQTLNYYCIGDPFAFFACLVPERATYIFFSAMSILRLYFAGLSFIFMCFEFNRQKHIPIISGALIYVFYHYSMINAAYHPYFLNPLILFPLVISGIERIINGKPPKLFIIAATISAISNLYFFYMIALLAGIFAIVRLFDIYRNDFPTILRKIALLCVFSIISVLISSFVFLPSLYAFASDPRMGKFNPSIFYPLSHYFNLAFSLFSIRGDFYLTLSFPIITALTFFHFCIRPSGKSRTSLTLLFILTLFLIFPIFGQIINGFGYKTNRWNWAASLFVAFLFVSEQETLTFGKKSKEMIFSVALIVIFCLLIIARIIKTPDFAGTGQFKCFIAKLVLFAIFVLFHTKKEFSSGAVKDATKINLIFVLLSIFTSSLFFYTSIGDNFLHHCYSKDDVNMIFDNEASKVKEFTKDEADFFRFTFNETGNPEENFPSIAKISSTSFYWTISNKSINDFFDFLSIPRKQIFRYAGVDERAIPLSLSAVKYFYLKGSEVQKIPFGFEPTSQPQIFKNANFLPLGYTYDSFFLLSDAENLSDMQKQEIMLSSIIVKEPISSVRKNDSPVFESLPVNFTVTGTKDVEISSNNFVAKEKNASIDISFEGLPKSETYVSFKNLVLKPENRALKESIISISIDDGSTKFFTYCSQNYEWYHQQKNFSVNMGYSKEAKDFMRITFEEPGTYSFDSFEINCLPLAHLSEKIDLLKKNCLEDVKISTNKMTAKIICEKDCVLCVQIPYLKGWKTFVDGKRKQPFQGNLMYISLELEKGSHTIELDYESPLVKISIALSLLGLVLAAYTLKRSI